MPIWTNRCLLACLCLLAAHCGGAETGSDSESSEATDDTEDAVTGSAIKHVFVIVMENKAASKIYGHPSAPYINNTLIPNGSRAKSFIDELPALQSEPHYIWMEAATNKFGDHTFTTDGPPSGSNSTSSTAHIASQIKGASNGVTWMSYQEEYNPAKTGACPIVNAGNYAVRHNPFVFFQDISGNPPSKTNAYCAAHHKPFSALSGDLANDNVATYNFITPSLCHDMHANSCAGKSDPTKQGDDWLKAQMPALLSYANSHAGVIMITWDEGSTPTPFVLLGAHVKKNYSNNIKYDHSSLVKSVDRILALPILSAAKNANDFADFFEPGFFP